MCPVGPQTKFIVEQEDSTLHSSKKIKYTQESRKEEQMGNIQLTLFILEYYIYT